MAIVKPAEEANSTRTLYNGVQPVALWDFKDRTNEFDWADIFISVELKQMDSDYSRFLEIAGRLDKDTDGKITGGFILKRLYHLFDVIGFDGGLTPKGTWEDGKRKEITNIGSHLNERFQTGNPILDPSYDYLVYIYREVPRKAGQKSYTRVHHKMFKNNDKGRSDLTSHVEWMTAKGFLKEWHGDVPPTNTDKQPVLAGENL